MGADIGEKQGMRPHGLLVLALLVVAGVGVTAGYLQWKAPDIRAGMAQTAAAVRAAPNSISGRLANWIAYGNPLIHHRLQEMRLSPKHPWLVTHAVGSTAPGAELEFYGIDLDTMPKELARIDGSIVRVTLPKPRHLGRAQLTETARAFVPVYAEHLEGSDQGPRLVQLAEFALGGLGRALARDIESASFAIDVGADESWPK